MLKKVFRRLGSLEISSRVAGLAWAWIAAWIQGLNVPGEQVAKRRKEGRNGCRFGSHINGAGGRERGREQDGERE